jgi:hypothetical protein
LLFILHRRRSIDTAARSLPESRSTIRRRLLRWAADIGSKFEAVALRTQIAL